MQTLVLWWRQHMKPLRRAAIMIQALARGYLVRLHQYGRRLIGVQARIRGVLARMHYAAMKVRLRAAERVRWLTEQAHIDIVVFHKVRDILKWTETAEGIAAIKAERKVMKVRGMVPVNLCPLRVAVNERL